MTLPFAYNENNFSYPHIIIYILIMSPDDRPYNFYEFESIPFWLIELVAPKYPITPFEFFSYLVDKQFLVYMPMLNALFVSFYKLKTALKFLFFPILEP